MNKLEGLSLPEFRKRAHIRYMKNVLKKIVFCEKEDPNRVILIQFSLLSLAIMGEIDNIPQEQKEFLKNWIYSLQVVDNENFVSGFQGSPVMNTLENRDKPGPYKWGHIANTYSALVILILLEDDLSRVDKQSIIRSLKYLQQEDGSFTASRLGNTESDMRFVFCASAISYILNDWSGFDLDKMKQYVFNCISYEQAFGQTPFCEAHSGSTFCAIASLYLSGNLENLSKKQKKGLIRWLINKANYGFCGRTNKPSDTCYSFWTGGSLHLLQVYDLIAPFEPHRYMMMFNQSNTGGFAKFESVRDNPDPLHTCMGLAGLSMMKIDELEEVHVPLVITKRGFEHLKTLHDKWEVAC